MTHSISKEPIEFIESTRKNIDKKNVCKISGYYWDVSQAKYAHDILPLTEKDCCSVSFLLAERLLLNVDWVLNPGHPG